MLRPGRGPARPQRLGVSRKSPRRPENTPVESIATDDRFSLGLVECPEYQRAGTSELDELFEQPGVPGGVYVRSSPPGRHEDGAVKTRILTRYHT